MVHQPVSSKLGDHHHEGRGGEGGSECPPHRKSAESLAGILGAYEEGLIFQHLFLKPICQCRHLETKHSSLIRTNCPSSHLMQPQMDRDPGSHFKVDLPGADRRCLNGLPTNHPGAQSSLLHNMWTLSCTLQSRTHFSERQRRHHSGPCFLTNSTVSLTYYQKDFTI